MKEILDFISNFKGAENIFLHGCCYWFAWILQERFHKHGYLVDILHDPIEGHFFARVILGEIPTPDAKIAYFDARGDVTHLYKPHTDELEVMSTIKRAEPNRYKRLLCDCKYFIDRNEFPPWLK